MRERRITAGAGTGVRWGAAASSLVLGLFLAAPIPLLAQAQLSGSQAAPEEPAPQAASAAVQADQPAPSTEPGGSGQGDPSSAVMEGGAVTTDTTATGAPSGGQPATAPTGTGAPAQQEQSQAPADERSFVDTLHGGVSSGFLSTATWLDSFFSDERYEAEANRSQFKLRFDAFRESGSGMDYRQPSFTLRLVLPQLRQRTRLLISGDPVEDADTTTAKAAGAAAPPKVTERNIETSLQYVPVETKRSNFRIRAGVRLSGGEVTLLAGPRYRYLHPLGRWDLRFTEEVLWSSVDRWQSRTRFDLERPLPRDLFFRSSLEGIWLENIAGYAYNLSLTLVQPLDRDRALQYEWSNAFTTQPFNGLVEELLVLRYRQRFLREWLFLEIAPQYRFPRDRGFEALPGILFRLEMVFGDIRR